MSRFISLIAALTLTTTPALAQEDGWRITSFQSHFEVHPNGSLDVVERIEVDFGTLRRHGIYRDIQVEYRRVVSTGVPIRAGRVNYDLDVRRVTDHEGMEWGVHVSRPGNGVRIRIGDSDIYVTGRQTYVIHYTLSGGLGFYDDYDELYWQVTGAEWPVPIDRAEATVSLPETAARAHADATPWDAWCYAGRAQNTSNERCSAEVVEPGLFRFATAGLAAFEGLTMVATFPKEVVPGPTLAEEAWDWTILFGPLLIPFAVFWLLFRHWRRHGKEPPMGSIVPLWEPPANLRPGPAGTLVDQTADMDDVIATIMDLAVRGYIQIREVEPEMLPGIEEGSFLGRTLEKLGVREEDWELVRLQKDNEGGLAKFERRVLKAVFDSGTEQRLSDLRNEFYKELPKIREALYDELVQLGHFPRRPDKTRQRWVFAGVGALIVAGVLGTLGIILGHWLWLPVLLVSGAFVMGFAFAMPKMTMTGAHARREAEGLKEYIQRAEKAELEFGSVPEKTPQHFETFLPYAIALDVSDIWVDQFEEILTEPPTWYVGRTPTWSSSSFNRSLTGFHTAATATLASAPGSSGGSGSFGGGSVGGGGGGGGGGAW